jgi:hypothetical protein
MRNTITIEIPLIHKAISCSMCRYFNDTDPKNRFCLLNREALECKPKKSWQVKE